MSAIGQEPIAEQVRRLLEPVLERDGYELVDVEWLRQAGRWTLRVFIDKPGGIGIDECQAVSRTVEPILDVEDLHRAGLQSGGLLPRARPAAPQAPGLRSLRRPARQREDLRAHRRAAPELPPRKHWTGTLRGFRDGAVEIDVDGVVHRIPLDRIAKAHLEYDLAADLREEGLTMQQNVNLNLVLDQVAKDKGIDRPC